MVLMASGAPAKRLLVTVPVPRSRFTAPSTTKDAYTGSGCFGRPATARNVRARSPVQVRIPLIGTAALARATAEPAAAIPRNWRRSSCFMAPTLLVRCPGVREAVKVVRVRSYVVGRQATVGHQAERNADHVVSQPAPIQLRVIGWLGKVVVEDVREEYGGESRRSAQRAQRVHEALDKGHPFVSYRGGVLTRLEAVEDVLVHAMIEHGVDGRPTHPVVVHQRTVLHDAGPRPQGGGGWSPSQGPVGNLKDDGEHILVGEEVAIDEVEVVDEPEEVEEEGIAAQARVEAIGSVGGDGGIGAKRDRRGRDDHLRPGAVGPIHPTGLLTVHLR